MMRVSRRSSVKESFDNLPSGVCFADRHGVIILCNRQMHRLCHMLLGTGVQHVFELRDALRNPPQNIRRSDDVADIFYFPDGEVWDFKESTVSDSRGKAYTQIQAFPVTELYAKKAELEHENHLLAEINERARQLYSELDQTVREEETFAVKMRVHNEIGLRLLTAHRILSKDDATLSELQEAGKMWTRSMHAFRIADTIPYGSKVWRSSSTPPAESLKN